MKELEEYPATVDVTKEEKHKYAKKKWRSFDTIDKLHNIIKYIRDSPQRREVYSIIRDELQKNAEKRLKVSVMNNNIRWRSVMDMIEYALENRIHLNMYCRDIKELDTNRLIEEDWIELKMIHI